MADRPCRLRLRSCLLSALLMSSAMTAHAVGIAAPQVMSGFNEPLKARVALLDTGALRASDLRVTLADSARWQAMDVMRNADTDTLRLAVNGTPGHLYLDIQGSRALETPWLDVVLTLRWPEGELTPQLTLLPSADATPGAETTPAAALSSGQGVRNSAPVSSGAGRNSSTGRQTHETAPAVQDNRRFAALEERIGQLEQQLRTSREEQSALMADIESVRAQSLASQVPSDSAAVQALASRQKTLETRLDQLDQEVLAAGVSAPDATSPREPSMQDAETSPREAAGAPASEPSVSEPTIAGRDSSFVWSWALAALLLISTGAWAGVRRWRQRRYRLVSATELSPMDDARAQPEDTTSAGEGGGEAQETYAAGTEQDEVWAAHRAQIEAICNEAEVFHRHHRREHAITMLKEGLEHYPNDFQLIRALAALEAAPDNDDVYDGNDDRLPQAVSTPAFDDSPTLVPAWSLQSFSTQDEVIDPDQGNKRDSATGKGEDFSMTPTAGFPRDWMLEEVAFEGTDTDNERPDADRSYRHA